MYDASAKLPSGILQGNINQFGDFDECLLINAVFKKAKDSSGIKGKYCLANIDVQFEGDTENVKQALSRVESFSFVRSTVNDVSSKYLLFINYNFCSSLIVYLKIVKAVKVTKLQNLYIMQFSP